MGLSHFVLGLQLFLCKRKNVTFSHNCELQSIFSFCLKDAFPRNFYTLLVPWDNPARYVNNK